MSKAMSPLYLIAALLVAAIVGTADPATRNIPREVVPLITRHELETLAWTSSNLTLRHGRRQYLFENYTQYSDPAGHVSMRYLKRKLVTDRVRLAQEHTEQHPNLRKRGNIINPDLSAHSNMWLPWNWRDQNCPVQIEFCFRDDDVENHIKDVFDEALESWNKGLGKDRGVDLSYTKGDPTIKLPDRQCYTRGNPPEWGVSNDAVVITMGDGGTHATTGWVKGTAAGRMFVNWDQNDVCGNTITERVKWYVGSMMHEIGHVLGLQHEHQRYDAANYITWNIDNFLHIDKLPDQVRRYNLQTGESITVDDVKTGRDNVWVARDIGTALKEPMALIFALMPFPLDANDEDFAIHGAFDWDSIMLYDSMFGAKSPGQLALVLKQGGGTFAWSGTTSDGDVRAVKKMYPDVKKQP